jgi:hypothetical protein
LSEKDCSYLRVWTGPYQPKSSENASVSEALREVAMKPLKTTEHRDGYLYILCDKDYAGRVKIGWTTNIARRLNEWNTRCKRTHRLSSSLGQYIEIPHCTRIERLIFTELKEFRINHGCEGCGHIHSEWFAVEEIFAVNVLQKWQNWVAQKPYAPCDSSDEWKIRPEMLDTLPLHLPIS